MRWKEHVFDLRLFLVRNFKARDSLPRLAVCLYGTVTLEWFSKQQDLKEGIGEMSKREGLC